MKMATNISVVLDVQNGVFFVVLSFSCILYACDTAQHVRDILGVVDTLKELSANVESRNVVAFIKDTNFCHCI